MPTQPPPATESLIAVLKTSSANLPTLAHAWALVSFHWIRHTPVRLSMVAKSMPSVSIRLRHSTINDYESELAQGSWDRSLASIELMSPQRPMVGMLERKGCPSD